ncbi:MAG: hypothetical protein WD928_13840 [Gammaproteobacteria bacterium]
MYRAALLITLIALSMLPASALAERAPESGHSAYHGALRAFEAGNYADAAALLERLLDSDGSCARCAHLLGKTYGRMAEEAGWTQAMRLAQKTRSALEQAVELAPDDVDAISDLIRYYRAAPGFLGGSSEKAERLELRLEELLTAHAG